MRLRNESCYLQTEDWEWNGLSGHACGIFSDVKLFSRHPGFSNKGTELLIWNVEK